MSKEQSERRKIKGEANRLVKQEREKKISEILSMNEQNSNEISLSPVSRSTGTREKNKQYGERDIGCSTSKNNVPIVSTKVRIWMSRKQRGKLKIWNL